MAPAAPVSSGAAGTCERPTSAGAFSNGEEAADGGHDPAERRDEQAEGRSRVDVQSREELLSSRDGRSPFGAGQSAGRGTPGAERARRDWPSWSTPSGSGHAADGRSTMRPSLISRVRSAKPAISSACVAARQATPLQAAVLSASRTAPAHERS